MDNADLSQNVINIRTLIRVNNIIEKDRLSSTYKFALLKATIDAVQKYDHLIEKCDNYVKIPLGLVIESWFFDYLPFVFENIRQQNNGNVLNSTLEELYHELFSFYGLKSSWKEAYGLINKKYEYADFDRETVTILEKIFKKLAKTVASMPMKYIGDSHYAIYKPDRLDLRNIHFETFDRKNIIKKFPKFSIPKDFYHVFKYIGQNLFGISTIANRWREVTIKLNPKYLFEDIFSEILFRTFVDSRDTNVARQLLPDTCKCVWTGKTIRKYDIDHILPYSVWFSNDLWNLMPVTPAVNRQKGAKIPTPELIKKRQSNIIKYWTIYKEKSPVFTSQREVALGYQVTEDKYIDALCEKARYLIKDRGLEPFAL